MSTRWARLARGWLTALFSTLIAALSHTLAGGPPSTLAVVVSLAFAGMLCVGLTGKKPSAARLAASVGGSQLLFHELFALVGHPTWGAVAGHVHGASGAVAPFAAVSAGPLWQPDSPNDAAWMLIAHLAAAVLTFLMLLHGERAFWTLSTSARELVRLLFPALPEPVAADAATVTVLASQTDVPSRRSQFRSAQYRRGPPMRPAFA
jgi:hypothetical protein